MAASGETSQPQNSTNTVQSDSKFDEFYTEVKEIEARDSVLTNKDQIARLTRPGATYFNLNPYDVLQLDPETSLKDVKIKYRRLSILVHPDKNQDNPENAQKAFEAVNKAYKTLENEEGLKRCQEIVEEARERVNEAMKSKKKSLKKEGKAQDIPEDTDEGYRHAVYVQTCKLFADLERMRQQRETQEVHERKRKAEEEADEEERKKIENEWKKNYEESRADRVTSWRDFTKSSDKKAKKKAKAPKGFKPPKPKMEQR